MIETAAMLEAFRQEKKAAMEREKQRVLICAGTGCVANGSLRVYDELYQAVAKEGLAIAGELEAEDGQEGIAIKQSGCHGFCEMGPLVRIEPQGVLYVSVKPEDAAEIAAA